MNISVLHGTLNSRLGSMQRCLFILMFIIYVENGFILHLVQGLIKIKVALEGESRREEGNKRNPGLLVSWKCRSIIVWMEMRIKNYNYGPECSSLVCGCGEDRGHLNYCWCSDLG